MCAVSLQRDPAATAVGWRCCSLLGGAEQLRACSQPGKPEISAEPCSAWLGAAVEQCPEHRCSPWLFKQLHQSL